MFERLYYNDVQVIKLTVCYTGYYEANHSRTIFPSWIFLFNSKVIEDVCDVKSSKKGRKSVLKPDLSVIPESAVEESSKADGAEDIIKEYSRSRRLVNFLCLWQFFYGRSFS